MSRDIEFNSTQERNIEIKARIHGGSDEFKRRIEIAEKLTGKSGVLIKQRDIFFNSPLGGRLKLRYLQPNTSAELIVYERPDIPGPKLSNYCKVEINQPEIIEKILTQTNGTLGVLVKERLLFMYGLTRIHIDQVETLGNFMEFEVRLKPGESIEDSEKLANNLMTIFRILGEELISGSYIDELKK